MKRWRRIGIWGIVLCLAAMQVLSASADAPVTPTPAAVETPIGASPTPGIDEAPLQLAQGPATPTLTPALPGDEEASDGATPASGRATVTPTATPTPTAVGASPTSTPTPPGTAHMAVLIGESVIPVGGTGSSEVFLSLRGVEPGVQGLELHLSFDPAIARALDADSDPANGTQIAAASFFGSSQVQVANRVDNDAGTILLALAQQGGDPVHDTGTWKRVATITWLARQEGKSVIVVDPATRFAAADGRLIALDAAYNGVVFARPPGVIVGVVKLQGRADHRGVSVSSSLAAMADQASTGADGQFRIVTSHGEGFYSLTAAMPGYLSAESAKPVKVTVGSVVDVGEVTLYGGDATGDDVVDIRDLAYVAYHFEQYDANADVNGDGTVDILDLSLTAGNFGQRGPSAW